LAVFPGSLAADCRLALTAGKLRRRPENGVLGTENSGEVHFYRIAWLLSEFESEFTSAVLAQEQQSAVPTLRARRPAAHDVNGRSPGKAPGETPSASTSSAQPSARRPRPQPGLS